MRDILFCISGPSGVGKGTLVRELLKDDPTLALSISCTTRQPRKGERHGVEYFFITREEFLKMRDEGGFIEYDEHFEHFYGTPKSYVFEQLANHKSVLLEIDVVGALDVRKTYQGSESCNVVLIMVVPPTLEALETRLLGRGSETKEEIETRRARVRYELDQQSKYDYIVVNDDFKDALKQLKEIISKEKNRQ